ncbi:uncharacterized protein LOC127102604 [Lathyrus oleraceus]|uniref:uncharacterized protein LOC127102604 n=1 Tax=Pisum sativum TaxID=3888 RepID=UPI0021CE8FC2|nr:uncharacterized protein LOC127102604 [Pisum sativum]
MIIYDGQKTDVFPLVIHLVSSTPYESDKVVPYKYNATMVEDDKMVLIPSFSSIVNIADRTKDVVIEKSNQEKTIVTRTIKSSSVNQNVDQDEVLKLIKISDFNMVDQLLHTPSKISVLSLLMSSEDHQEALQKVLEQAYVDHSIIIDHFDGIVDNITSCNNLSFNDEELLEQGRNHNLALYISMNSQEYTMSNVLVDTGSFFNVLPKSTMSKLSYQGAPMRFSAVVVKAFDGSRKTITFKLIDIHPAYSCLLGLPWIHEDGAVTSTLHQKLKFVKNGKLVIMGGEKALFKNEESVSSLKDAQHVFKNGQSAKWGQIVELAKNNNRAGLGFSHGSTQRNLKRIQEVFQSVGFIHSKDQYTTAILEDDEEKGVSNFVTRGSMCKNWIGVDVPFVIHLSKLPLKPECSPVKQKLRKLHPNMAVKIKEEVQKHIDAGFLVTVEYPQWVANIVPVPKKDDKV